MRRKKPHQLPFIANWLMTKFLGKHLLEELEGDLLEMYHERLSARGRSYAQLMYWVDVIHLTLGFIGKRSEPKSNWSLVKHYFIISFRNLSRDKVYSTVNVMSLALGMGVALALSQYIFSEYNHDPSLRQNPNLYRLTLERSLEGSLVDRDLYTAHSLAASASHEIPEILTFTRLYVPNEGAFASRLGQRPFSIAPSDIYYADQNFLNFFKLELKLGDPNQALNELFSVVISERIAKRHFGNANPIGQLLTIGGGASHGDYVVTGVIPNRPNDSHLQFDFLFPILNFMEYGWLGAVKRHPHVPWFVNYFELSPQANKTKVQQQLDNILVRHKPEWNPELTLTENTSLQAISEIHLDPNRYANGDYVTDKANLTNLNSYLIIAIFILIIAWFNYINLATAQSTKRTREIGVRKSLGANRTQLIYQFLAETITINILSAFFALVIGYYMLSILGDLLGKELSFTIFLKSKFWFYAILTIITGALISGIYPAFLLTRHQPISMLLGKMNLFNSKFSLRQAIVTFQFLIALLLISGTYLVHKQIYFMQNEDLGLNMDQVLVVNGPKHIEVLDGGPQLTNYDGIQTFQRYSRKTFHLFRNEILKSPTIRAVSGSWHVPGDPNYDLEDGIRRWGTPESENRTVKLIETGLDFLKTYELQLIAGETFTADHFDTRAVILNEKAVQLFGFHSPIDAIGAQLYFGDPLTIKGVVKDFHWHSLKEDHSPWVIWLTGSTPGYFSMKLNTANLEETITKIQEIYDQLYPGNPFEYFFIDDQFNQQYQADRQFRDLFLTLTILTIIVACIGLFAMISYAVTLKFKEIGIRKVLGASLIQLMIYLSKTYFRLLALAIVLALPLINYLGKNWLNNYAFRTDMGIDIFLAPSCMLILISILTVSHRTFHAARANPVDALRSE